MPLRHLTAILMFLWDRNFKGDTICIVEAMKCMNEIQSELDGEVTEILVKDGDLVEYGQPLFRVK